MTTLLDNSTLTETIKPAEYRPAEVRKTAVDPLYERTEDQLAREFAETYGDKLRYDHARNTWFVWDGNRWKPDADGLTYRMALKLARERWNRAWNIPDRKLQEAAGRWAVKSRTFKTLEGTLRAASKLEPIADDGTSWDTNPWLLGVKNGVIDLRTGKLRDGCPDDRITKTSPVEFRPDAECVRWEKFLEEIFCQDQEIVDYIHKAIGYSLTGDTSEQCFFLCFGGGHNGKSRFIEVLMNLLGRELTTTLDFDSLSLSDRPKYELADVEGARLVLASENERKVELSSKVVKQLTGGDLVSARQIRERTRRFVPIAKIWLAANHKPAIRDMSDGMWRRVKEIPFTARFEIGKNADQGLDAKLRAELPGILRWAVEGCLKWQKERLLPMPKAMSDAIEEYREESDKCLAYIREKLDFGPMCSVPAGELQTDYEKWKSDKPTAPGYDSLTASLRGRSCIVKPVRIAGKKVKVWQGITLAKR